VKSAPKQGSAFTIYLTRADVALAVTEAAAGPLPRGGGERVLLVDDEAPLLAVTAEVLSRLGYDAVSFDDSHSALAAFEAAPGRFDVVVTDEVMPGLTGTGLARALRRRRPDLPIVLVSGYSGPILTRDALAAGGQRAAHQAAPVARHCHDARARPAPRGLKAANRSKTPRADPAAGLLRVTSVTCARRPDAVQ